MKVQQLIGTYILLFIFFIIGSTTSLAFADAEKIFRENSKAVVLVVTFDNLGTPESQGSGFIVRSDGAVVTNYHVISNASDIKIKLWDKVLDVEGIIYEDKENDLVILKAIGENLPTVRLGDIKKESVGEKIYVISSPKGLENTISDGLLSGIREISDKKKILQITAPISHGSSGSPVFNKEGEVIGIATFLLKESQNLNFAMPVNIIKSKFNDKKIISLKGFIAEDYTKTSEYWFYLGVNYYESNMYLEAIEAFKQAIMIKPSFADAHYGLGVAYGNSGKNQKSIDAYKQAIKIKPDDANSHLHLGVAHAKSGNYQEAIDAFKESVRIKPGLIEAHLNLGITYVILNEKGYALDQYKILKDLNEDMANELFNLIYP